MSVEELADSKPPFAENENVDMIFLPNHRRGESGRCVIQLLFRDTGYELDDNQSQNLRRFTQLERSLSRPPDLKPQYSAIIDNLDWADQVPGELRKEWLEHQSSLDELNDFQSQRCAVEPDAACSEDEPQPRTVELIDDSQLSLD